MHYISNSAHYKEVLSRIFTVKHTLWIGTADIKDVYVDVNGEVKHYDDDADYGSDFSHMIDAIAWTEDVEIQSCHTTLGENPEPNHLDDGSSWAEGCLDVPQFKGISVCYAVHDICTHKNYSVPDLLRIRSYSVLNTIKGNQKRP